MSKPLKPRDGGVNRPEGVARPISEAPRDGTKIIVERRKTPTLKYPIVTARWQEKGYWVLSIAGCYALDETLLGWWPIEDGVTTYRVAS